MDAKKIAGPAALATGVSVALFCLMGMNFIGWLGAWFAQEAGAWIVDLLLAAALCFAFAWLWVATAGPRPFVKKLPAPVGGVLYGILVGLVFATVIPLLLSATAGGPRMGENHSATVSSLGRAFGVHMVPALPDLGFDPPLRGLVRGDWVSLDDYGNRLLPFMVAFAGFGVVLGLTGRNKR